MTLKERVQKYCYYKGIAVSKFEKISKLANGYFNQVKKRPSKDKIDSIVDNFPDLNIEWLLTGEGEMIKPPKNPFSQLTEEVIEERVVDNVKAYIDNMFESGRAYHASAVERMLKEKDKEIERLREELRKEQEENVRLKAQKGLE